MLNGKGIGNYTSGDQSWMLQYSEDKRKKGLYDRNKLTEAERLKYEISGAQGGGIRTNSTYEMWQFPYPTNPAIRKRQKIDMRLTDPSIGDEVD